MSFRLPSSFRPIANRVARFARPTPWVSCLLLGGLLFASLPAQAQSGLEIELIEGPSDAEVHRFLKKHIPEAAPLLDQLIKDEGGSSYRELLEQCAMSMMAYEETLGYDGKAAASNYLEIVRTEFRIENDIVMYFEPEQKPERKTELRKTIIERSASMRQLEIIALKFELESTRALAQEIEQAIAEQESLTRTDLVNHVDQLLSDELYVNPETKEGAALRQQLPDSWQTEMDAAKKEQKESGKPMVMLISTAWCEPCHQLFKQVLGSSKVEAAVERVVPVYIDGERSPAVLRKHRIRMVPTFLALDADGRVYSRLSGLVTKGELSRWLGKIARKGW